MAARLPMVLAIAVLVAIQVATAFRPVVRKPGRCPDASKNPGICLFGRKFNCLSDFACPERQKCCPEGCGRECKLPCPVRRCSVKCREFYKDKRGCSTCRCKMSKCPLVKCAQNCKQYVKDKNGCRTCRCVMDKRGTCPPASRFPGPCWFRTGTNCLGDFACPGNRKCCAEGCGRVCKVPCRPRKCSTRCREFMKDERGCPTCRCKLPRCPVLKCPRVCKEYMKNRHGCRVCRCKVPRCPVFKCSRRCRIYQLDKNGCRTCRCAVTKPGECPKPLPIYCIRSSIECRTDSDCRGNQKCCRVACGKACKSPITKLLPPVKCKRGEKRIPCFANPCHYAKCGHRGAKCAPNYCNKCAAEFYDQKGNRVCNKSG